MVSQGQSWFWSQRKRHISRTQYADVFDGPSYDETTYTEDVEADYKPYTPPPTQSDLKNALCAKNYEWALHSPRVTRTSIADKRHQHLSGQERIRLPDRVLRRRHNQDRHNGPEERQHSSGFDHGGDLHRKPKHTHGDRDFYRQLLSAYVAVPVGIWRLL